MWHFKMIKFPEALGTYLNLIRINLRYPVKYEEKIG